MDSTIETPSISLRNGILYYLAVWLCLGALFTPLLVMPDWFIFPFIVPKVVALRVMMVLAVSLIVPLLYFMPSIRPKMRTVHYVVLVYLGVIFLSGIFGQDFYRSFWSTHERMLGIFSVLHYSAYFFLASVLFRGWEGKKIDGIAMYGWRVWVRVAVIGASMVAVVGIAQRFGHNILYVEGGGRVFGTLGNFIYLGNYMATSLWLIALLFLKEKNRAWKICYSALALLQFAAFIFSGSRGAVFGTIGAIIITYVFIIIFGSARSRRVGGLILLITFALIMIILISPLKGVLQKNNLLSRYVTISADIKPRLIAWGVAYESWKQHPVFGWGFENFYMAFNQNFNPQSLEFSFYETWFDSAHNIFLNTLATTGIIGLLSYLALYGATIAMVVAGMKRGNLSRSEGFILIGFLCTDFGSKLFVFDHPSSYLLLFGVMAMSSDRAMPSSSSNSVKRISSIEGSLVLILSLGVAVALIFNTDIVVLRGNNKTLQAMRALHTDPRHALQYVRAAFAYPTPHIVDVRLDLAHDIKGIATFLSNHMEKDEFVALLTEVLNELEHAKKVSPRDVQVYMADADLALLLAQSDARFYQRVEEDYKSAIALSPTRQQLYYMYAKAKAVRGDFNGALLQLDFAVELDKKVGYSYWIRAYIRDQGKLDPQLVWKDIVSATLALRDMNYVPGGTQELDFTSRKYVEAGLYRFDYDLKIIELIEAQGQMVPVEIIARLYEEYRQLGLNDAAREIADQLSAQYKYVPKITIAKDAPSADIEVLDAQIKKYQQSSLIPPLSILEAKIYAASLIGNKSEFTQAISDTITYYPSNESGILWNSNECPKNKKTSYEVLVKCVGR